MFIRGETLSAHSARPRELRIPKWIVLVRENVAVNKRAYRKKQLKLYSEGFDLKEFEVLKTSIFAREGQIFVLRTSNFQGATSRPIPPIKKLSIDVLLRRAKR